MIRSNEQFKGGCGAITFRLESDEEIAEFLRVFPLEPIPGVLRKHEWVEHKLRVWTEIDPTYVAPTAARTRPADSNVIAPVPTLAQLADKKLEDLVTLAAELSPYGCAHRPGETKAALAGKILAAWTKKNEELAKAPAK